MREFEFATTPSIIMRNGASCELVEILTTRFQARHVFLVTDKGVCAAGILEPALKAIKKSGIAVTVFDSIIADPPEQTVLDAVAAAKEAQADCIVGFGGGSPMDTAKVVAYLLTSSQSLQDIYGVGNITEARTIPLVLVPTTAGTGSEVTPISIITTGETTKAGIVAPQLYADVALLDPALTVGLPSHITAATGIDAMVHAFEAYTSRLKKNPVSDMLARNALSKLHHNILTVCEKGDDLEARSEMLLGAMMAGQAFANAPVAAVHALAYPIGGIFHVPHGLSNALVMPHVLRFNLPEASQDYAELAQVIDPGIMGTQTQKAEHFIEKMATLSADTGIPTRLSDVGIKAKDMEHLSQDAMLQTRLLVNNPREVTLANAKSIYEAAL